MSKIRFLEDREVKDGTGEGEKFKKGQIIDLPEPSCRHWLDRGVAERVLPPEPDPHPEPELVEKPTVTEATTPARSPEDAGRSPGVVLKAVHKGRGVYAVIDDRTDEEVAYGLTKEEAEALVRGD